MNTLTIFALLIIFLYLLGNELKGKGQRTITPAHSTNQDSYGPKPYGSFESQQERDEYNQRKRQESEDHDAGFQAGGPVDETRSKHYRYGQLGRMEAEKDQHDH